MSVTPKISVIIPVYNTAEYLKEAVGSICNQTCKSLQIIVVDDGSTDSSPEILRQLAKEDSRIEIITRKNSGQGAARNKGLERAVGEYVYFMDSDDMFGALPGTLHLRRFGLCHLRRRLLRRAGRN